MSAEKYPCIFSRQMEIIVYVVIYPRGGDSHMKGAEIVNGSFEYPFSFVFLIIMCKFLSFLYKGIKVVVIVKVFFTP